MEKVKKENFNNKNEFDEPSPKAGFDEPSPKAGFDEPSPKAGFDEPSPKPGLDDGELETLFSADNTLMQITNRMNDGIGLYSVANGKLTIITVNDGYYKLFGYTKKTFCIDANNIFEKIYKRDQEVFKTTYEKVISDGVTREILARRIDHNGKLLKIRMKLCLVNKSETSAIICIVFNKMSEYDKIENIVLKDNMSWLMYLIFNSEYKLLFNYDIKNDILEGSMLQADNTRKEMYISKFLSEFMLSEQCLVMTKFRKGVLETIYRAIQTSGEYTTEYKANYNDEGYLWYRAEVKSVADEKGALVKVVGKVKNIEKEVTKIDELKKQAEIDKMTGYLNRNSAEQYINKKLSEKKIVGDEFAMLFDIDFFKNINDIYGHYFGDNIIKSVTSIVKNNLSKSIATRVGGDEFLLIFSTNIYPNYLEIYEKILKEITNLKEEMHIMVQISVSIGSIRITGEYNTFEKLYKKIDKVLYKSKNSGRNCYTIES